MTSVVTTKKKNIKIKKNSIMIGDKVIKRSPKTFLKECIFESVNLQKRRKKVSMEDFEIPTYKNYNEIVNLKH